MDRKLIDYLPAFLQKYREFRVLMEIEQAETEELWSGAYDAFYDCFLDTAQERGVKRREKMVGITPKPGDDLDTRKFRIRARENERLPYTHRGLEQMLSNLCGADGYKVSINPDEFVLSVKVELTARTKFDEVKDLLERVTPANMIIELIQMYNTHNILSQYTHDQLSKYTHDQLRNEVLKNV